MASTYVNDLRLNEMATGDGSGTWGTTTNTNLELIAEKFGSGSEALSDASTATITMADGASDAFRSLALTLTGSLSQACTVTLAPNTLSNVWMIKNSAGDAVTLTQGTGANVVIPNGFTKVVYSDGAGSGAAVVDVFDDLSIGPNLRVGNAAAEDTAIVFDGNAQDFYIGLDDSADDFMIGLGSTVGTTPIISVTDNKDVAIPDGTLTITTNNNEAQLMLISTDADASVGPILELYRNSGTPADNDELGRIYFYGENDNDEKIEYVLFKSNIVDASDGAEGSSLQIYTYSTGGQRNRIDLLEGETVFNEGSQDIDFRVEGNGDANAFFVNAGDDVVSYGGTGTNTRSPSGVVPKFQANSLTRMDSSISLCCNSNDALSSLLMFSKTRSAARTGATVCQADDAVGAITWNAADGTDIEHGIAAIDAVVESGIGSNDVPGALRFYTNGGTTSATERMRIDSSGFVGIGNTVATVMNALNGFADLTVGKGASDHAGITIFSGTAHQGAICFADGSDTAANSYRGVINYNHDDNSMTFFTNNTERMRIKTDGKTGIGTNNPGGRFMIEADGSSEDILVINNTRSGSNSTAIQQFKREGTNTGFIANTSSATSYATSQSDRRAKKNFEDWTESVLSHFKDLKPTKFHFTQEDDSGEKNKGYIAQDLVSSFPEAYPLKDSGEDADRYFFNPSGMVVYLMKAIQEQQALIESLEAKVKVLEEA